jgi:hypothetical protein
MKKEKDRCKEFDVGDLVELTNAVGQRWGVFGIIYNIEMSPDDSPRVPMAWVRWATTQDVEERISFIFIKHIAKKR